MFTSNITKKEISGIVYDKETKEILVGVKVITDTDTTYTDFDGKFKIKNDSLTTKIRFDYISYERYSETISSITYSYNKNKK